MFVCLGGYIWCELGVVGFVFWVLSGFSVVVFNLKWCVGFLGFVCVGVCVVVVGLVLVFVGVCGC